MPICGTSRLPKIGALDRDLALKKARMDRLFDSIEEEGAKGEMKRLALGLMSGESTDNPAALSKAVEYFIYGAIGRKPPENRFILDDVEIARLEAILHTASSDASRAMKMGNKLVKEYGSVEAIPREKLKTLSKFWTARGPFTMELAHTRLLPGGSNLFGDLVMMESEHKARIKSSETSISHIVDGIRDITSEHFGRNVKRMAVIDQELRLLGDQYRMTQEAVDAGDPIDPGKLSKIQNKIDIARQKRARMLSDDDNTNSVALVNRAIIDIIEAKTPEERNKKAEEYNRLHGLDENKLKGMILPIETMLHDYVAVGEQSVRYLRRLIETEMNRVGGSPAELEQALALIKPMGVIEKGYFPVQSLLDARPIEKVSLLKNMIDSIQFHGATKPQDVLSIISSMSGHMETRTGSVDKENRDLNVASVLQHYTSTMLHTNYVIKSQHAFGGYVSSLYKIGMESGNVDAQAYAIAADRMLDFTRRRMVGTQSHGVMHELSTHMLSYTVLTKLGIFRPAGMVRNLAEGGTMILTKVGMANMRRASKLWKEAQTTPVSMGEEGNSGISYRSIVGDIMAEHKLDLGHDSHVGEGPLGTLLTPKIKALIGDPELAETYLTVERIRSETHVHVLKAIDKYIQEQAGKVKMSRDQMMSAWSSVETLLRQKAFRTGAILAMDRTAKIYGDMFNNPAYPIPKRLIDKFDLDGSVLDGKAENSSKRSEQLLKLMRAEGTRGGLSLLYRSQGQYSVLARHPIEDFSPFGLHMGKMMHLFRQYPDSWNTQFALGARDMYHAAHASGAVEGWMKTTRTEKSEGYQWWMGGQPIMAAMIAMMAQLGVGAYLQNNKFGGIFGQGVRIAGMYRGDIPAVASFFDGITSRDEKTKKWTNGGRSLQSIFTGPMAAPVEWVVNMAAISAGFERGDLPLGTNTAAQVLGWNPDKEVQRLPENYNPTDFGDIAKATGQHWLNGVSVGSDINALRDEYNKAASRKGMAVLKAFLLRSVGAQPTYSPQAASENKP